uniref:ODAD1 central coiled coil region domain-containing protein n=1 Tax=Timema poppense TaxID=170557 RepID=A0A7R9D8N6_TIMPO|nr:unnamed protein product [Timema poppensis]
MIDWLTIKYRPYIRPNIALQNGVLRLASNTNYSPVLLQATVKFNKMLAENSELREELDHLIKERSHFNQLYQQLTSRLQSGKKVIVDLIEQATLAYDQREEAQSKLQALKDRGRVDLSVHSQEMRELQRQLDHNAKLQEFLGIKGQKRVMADLEERERQKKQNQKESQEQMIAMYQVILEKIKACSGEAEVDRLSAQFIKQEEENFALFNYVNELNNELELLQDQVNELKSKIEGQHEANRERAARHKETLGELDAEVSFRMRDADQSQDKLDATNKILSNLLEGIENIFELVRCDNAPILELLGNSSNVSSHSVMLYLGIIERRINDLLRLALYRNKIAAMG